MFKSCFKELFGQTVGRDVTRTFRSFWMKSGKFFLLDSFLHFNCYIFLYMFFFLIYSYFCINLNSVIWHLLLCMHTPMVIIHFMHFFIVFHNSFADLMWKKKNFKWAHFFWIFCFTCISNLHFLYSEHHLDIQTPVFLCSTSLWSHNLRGWRQWANNHDLTV